MNPSYLDPERMIPVVCVGGPADGQMHFLPVNPNKLERGEWAPWWSRLSAPLPPPRALILDPEPTASLLDLMKHRVAHYELIETKCELNQHWLPPELRTRWSEFYYRFIC